MPSDIFIKSGSSTWSKMTNMFIKTGTSTWSAAKAVWMYLQADWVKVWPLSGIYSTRKPWIAASSGDAYSSRLTSSNTIRIGTSYVGNNAQWNANGWTITGYQYAWYYYDSSNSFLGTLRSGTASGWNSTSGQDTLPTSVWTTSNAASADRSYLSFEVTATASNSSYNGTDASEKIYVIRRPPVNLSTSLNNYAPQVGTTITYSSSWNSTETYKIEAARTTIKWYKNSTNSTTGGTLVSSGSYSYTAQSSDLGYYIYAVETAYNSGSDYDYGSTVGVEAKVITTSTVAAALSAPTSVTINSVSRNSDTDVNVSINFSGGSGPYYQLYWISSTPAPTTAGYDAASTGSPILETFGFGALTYYFYVRSSTENLGNTTTNGSATAGTYSPYSTAYAQYTFSVPTGATASISGTSSTGSVLTYTGTSPTASPSATATNIVWRVNDGGPGGNSFTGGSVLQTGGSTFTIPTTMYGISTVGYKVRAEVTWNNGVGTQIANSNEIQITAPATKLSTPTNVSASDARSDGIQVSWTNVANAATYGVWWGGAPSYDSTPDFGGPNNNGGKTITSSPFLDDGVTTGTTRDYYVQAFPAVGSTSYLKSNWSTGDSGTRVAATVAPTISASSISPSSGTAGTTQFTASATASGTPSPTITYQWQYFSTSFTFVNVPGATSSTYSPPSNFNTLYPNYGFYCLITASNGVSPDATSRPSATLNNPVVVTAPGIPTSVALSLSGSVSWSAPSSGGTPTSYEIEFYTASNSTGSNAAGPYTVISISSSPYQLTSPYGGTNANYARVRVRARNSGGASDYSAWVPSATTYR